MIFNDLPTSLTTPPMNGRGWTAYMLHHFKDNRMKQLLPRFIEARADSPVESSAHVFFIFNQIVTKYWHGISANQCLVKSICYDGMTITSAKLAVN